MLIAERLFSVASCYAPGMFAVLGLKSFRKNAATMRCNGRCSGTWEVFCIVQDVGLVL